MCISTGNADLIFLRSNLYPFWILAKIILLNSDETGFLSDCPSLMLGIAIHCIQHSQAMLERGYVSLLTYLSFCKEKKARVISELFRSSYKFLEHITLKYYSVVSIGIIFLRSRPNAYFRLRVFAMIAGKLTLQGFSFDWI